MTTEFIPYLDDDLTKYRVAERFVAWLERRIVADGRGDDVQASDVNPEGRFWLGRLGPKDFVMLPDDRLDRLEPCAIGVRLRPENDGPWRFDVAVKLTLWHRQKSQGGGQRWAWTKGEPIELVISVEVPDGPGEYVFGGDRFETAFKGVGADGLTAEVRVRLTGRSPKAIEITVVNTSGEVADFADGRFFECRLSVSGLKHRPFELEALPDSFRYDRKVEAYGVNCGATVEGEIVKTSDGPACSRARPIYWSVEFTRARLEVCQSRK